MPPPTSYGSFGRALRFPPRTLAFSGKGSHVYWKDWVSVEEMMGVKD